MWRRFGIRNILHGRLRFRGLAELPCSTILERSRPWPHRLQLGLQPESRPAPPHVLHYVRSACLAARLVYHRRLRRGLFEPRNAGRSAARSSACRRLARLDRVQPAAYFQRYDLSITGFVIDGSSPGMGERGLQGYLQFSPDGLVGHKLPGRGLCGDRMPYLPMRFTANGSQAETTARIANLVKKRLPDFAVVRTILKSPSWHEATMHTRSNRPRGQAPLPRFRPLLSPAARAFEACGVEALHRPRLDRLELLMTSGVLPPNWINGC